MAELSSPTRRDFNMHKALLLSVIKKQAGSLDKAVLEGIMNSIDAGATRIDVMLSPLKVTITDDGRGFRDSTEIEDFFATFGTPHEEGDAVYGRFRMGRGQMFAFGVNTWRTGTFKMEVDVDTHIGYELLQNLDEAKGCAIEIKLYEPLPQYEVHNVERNITKMVKYAPVPIYINDERVNIDIDEKKFPQTTEDAYINVDGKASGLDIYNLGIYVCTQPAWKYGVSGVVVSRKQLDVNFARNEVLGSCPIWKRIRPLVDAKGKQKVTRTINLSDAEQENVINRLVSGQMKIYEAETVRFIKDTTGKAWSPKLIRNKHFEAFSVAEMGDAFADKLMQTGRAFVISKDCFELFECEAKDLFKKYDWYGMPNYLEMNLLTTDINPVGEKLDKKAWNKSEKAWMYVAEHMLGELCGWFRNEHGQYTQLQDRRQINVGTSQVALAWTDGATFVTFAREFMAGLKMFKNGAPNPSAFVTFAKVLLHEMCHDADSRENVHSPDFYRDFHDRSMKLGVMVADSMKYMTQSRYKKITGEFDLGDETD